MKKINIILATLTVLLIPSTIYLYIKFSNAQNRISHLENIAQLNPSMERDSLIRILDVKNIQETQYLTNLNILSDWIILYVTVLFGLVVIIQVFNFESRTKNVEDKYKQQEKANQYHFEKFLARFENLESDINAIIGRFYSMHTNIEKDSFSNFDLYLIAAESYLKSLVLKDESDKNYHNVKDSLEFALFYINKYEMDGKFMKLDTRYFVDEYKIEFEQTFQFLLSNLFLQEDKKTVIEIMKTFDRLCDIFNENK